MFVFLLFYWKTKAGMKEWNIRMLEYWNALLWYSRPLGLVTNWILQPYLPAKPFLNPSRDSLWLDPLTISPTPSPLPRLWWSMKASAIKEMSGSKTWKVSKVPTFHSWPIFFDFSTHQLINNSIKVISGGIVFPVFFLNATPKLAKCKLNIRKLWSLTARVTKTGGVSIYKYFSLVRTWLFLVFQQFRWIGITTPTWMKVDAVDVNLPGTIGLPFQAV